MNQPIKDFERALGPNWEEGREISSRFLEKFKDEHFEKMIEDFSDKFRDNLWTDITAFLLSDTRSNLAQAIRRRIDECVFSIISGDERLVEFYGLHKYDGAAARAAIAKAIPKEIQDARIADLEETVRILRGVRYE